MQKQKIILFPNLNTIKKYRPIDQWAGLLVEEKKFKNDLEKA